MSPELIVSTALTYVTGHGVYVTQVPPHRRRQHAEMVKALPRTVWVLCCYHGKWILWQVTMYLPRKRT